jgi:hypothetical protein
MGEWYGYMGFLISALVGGEWSASRLGHFTPQGKSPRWPLDRRLGALQSRSGRCRESNPQPVAIPTELPAAVNGKAVHTSLCCV